MLPLKDNIPTDRVPVVTVALIALAVAVELVTAADVGVAALVLGGWAIWVFGVSVEDAMARWRWVVLCGAGTGATVAAQLAVVPGAVDPAVAWTGAAATAVGAHAVLHPRARVVALVPIPFLAGLVELRAWALAAAWLAVPAVLAATTSVAWIAPFAGLAAGAAGVRLLAERRKRLDPPRVAVAP